MSDQKSYKKEDQLTRKPFAETIASILENRDALKRDDDRESFVLAIDAPWGSGKTFFLDYLAEHFKNLHNNSITQYIPVPYDSWEYDYWDSAFDPFVNNLLQMLQKNFSVHFSPEDQEKFAKSGLFKSMLSISQKLAKGFIAKKVGGWIGEARADALLNDLFSGKLLTEFDSNASDIPIVPLFQLHEDIKKLREGLDKIAAPPKHIVFLIDELDWAKPLFAVQTLEVTKHIFDAKQVSYIFALDMEQLSHTVKSVYGEGMDSVSYLHRFFDLVISLPRDQSSLFDYIETKITEKGFNDLIKEKTKEALEALTTPFNLHFRDINFLISHIKLITINKFSGYNPENYSNYSMIIPILLNVLCLKIKHRKYYDNLFCNSTVGADEMNDEYKRINLKGGFKYLIFIRDKEFRVPIKSRKSKTSESYLNFYKDFRFAFENKYHYNLSENMSMADCINSLLMVSEWQAIQQARLPRDHSDFLAMVLEGQAVQQARFSRDDFDSLLKVSEWNWG